MNENQSKSPAADSQREKLNELITLKKGKGGASQLEAKQFTNAWVDLAKTVGINDETIGLLYDGFQFAAGEPFYRYVSESVSKTAYLSLFSSKPTATNEQGIAFRVAINLFALELPKPTSFEAVKLIAHSIPNLSVNKDGKAFGTLGRSIGKILIKPLTRKKIHPDIHLPRKDASALLSVLKDPVEAFAKNPKVQSVEASAALSLLAWLSDQATADNGDSYSADEQPNVRTERPAETVATPPATQQAGSQAKPSPRSIAERPVRVSRVEPTASTSQGSSASTTKQPGDELPVSLTGNETRDVSQTRGHGMPEVIAFLSAYQSEFERLQARHEAAQSERRDALNRISVLEQQLRSARQDNAELQERVAGLSERCAELQSELNSQKESNDSLRGDLEAAEEMLSTIDKRDTRQADESSRRLARELKVEYTDFMDAADLPMSVELGENMRDQLRGVFQIIKANGIEL